MDSLVFDTIVGVVFVFGVFAFAVSGIVEATARFLGLRAEFLLRGVSSLLNSNTTFGKAWLSMIVHDADVAQRTADGEAIPQALADLDRIAATSTGSKLEETANQLKKALAAAQAAAAKRTAFIQANDELDKANGAPAGPNRDTAILKAKGVVAKAENELKAALADAQDEVEKVTSLLDLVPADIKPLTGNSFIVSAQGLAGCRRILLVAQRAVDAGDSQPKTLTVASVISTPIVDLTAALQVDHAALLANRLTWQTKRKLPSYLSSRTFSRALVNTLVPSPDGGKTTVEQLGAAIEGIADKGLREVLAGHLDQASATVDSFRGAVENWYDDHMARVTGWYKRHTRWYTLIVAAVLAMVFNVNAVAMAQAFYSDQALRESVVTAALSAADCNAADSKTTPSDCLQDVRKQIEDFRGAGLPIGWGVVPACEGDSPACTQADKFGLTSPTGDLRSDLAQVGLVALGWLIITLSALMGARFWFDALSKLNTLRSSGPKPNTSASTSS